MESEESEKKIVLPEELQRSILKFFLKTSIPRKAREERIKKSLSENQKEGQEIK